MTVQNKKNKVKKTRVEPRYYTGAFFNGESMDKTEINRLIEAYNLKIKMMQNETDLIKEKIYKIERLKASITLWLIVVSVLAMLSFYALSM